MGRKETEIAREPEDNKMRQIQLKILQDSLKIHYMALNNIMLIQSNSAMRSRVLK